MDPRGRDVFGRLVENQKKNETGSSAPDLLVYTVAVTHEKAQKCFRLKGSFVNCLRPLQMSTSEGRLILIANSTGFGLAGYGSRGREESSSTPRILVRAGGCVVMSSAWEKLRKGQAFAGRARVLCVI